MKSRPPFRVGIVKDQDLTNARVRVVFQERDQLTSWWLPVIAQKTQNDKAYWMPDIGEQVVCLMDERDEDGAVLGAIYSSADTTPVASADKWHVTMKDGASFEYDRTAHALAIALPSGATATVTANGATFQIDATGNIIATPASGKMVKLAGASALIALVGGEVSVPNVQSGSDTVIGTIIESGNSTQVEAS